MGPMVGDDVGTPVLKKGESVVMAGKVAVAPVAAVVIVVVVVVS